jgi:uncharacterized protein
MHMVELLTRLPGHHFWTMDVDFLSTVEPLLERFFGHQQVTDAYLLGLAIRKKGKLATFDKALRSLAGSGLVHYLEVLS